MANVALEERFAEVTLILKAAEASDAALREPRRLTRSAVVSAVDGVVTESLGGGSFFESAVLIGSSHTTFWTQPHGLSDRDSRDIQRVEWYNNCGCTDRLGRSTRPTSAPADHAALTPHPEAQPA